jgi:hypothetical protein
MLQALKIAHSIRPAQDRRQSTRTANTVRTLMSVDPCLFRAAFMDVYFNFPGQLDNSESRPRMQGLQGRLHCWPLFTEFYMRSMCVGVCV